ncbi:MAG: hypothetical protein N2484_04765 [Clostridia bacterium]|nr:hypothetical protein [Clostridia bacterium]
MDMQFGYSQTHVYDMLDRVGAAGRELYMGFLTLDFVFIVVFMFLLALLLTFLLEKAAVNSRMKILNLLPVIRSGMDAIENCLLLLVIFNYPVKLPIIVAISSMATILKWVSLVAILALIVILMIRIAWKAILPQKTIG